MEIRSGLDHGEHGELNWADHRDQILDDLHDSTVNPPMIQTCSPCPPRLTLHALHGGGPTSPEPGTFWWMKVMQSTEREVMNRGVHGEKANHGVVMSGAPPVA